jgi:hypothetical protein
MNKNYFLLFLVILLICGAVYVNKVKPETSRLDLAPAPVETETTSSTSAILTPEDKKSAEWPTYTDQGLGYKFSYPSYYKITYNENYADRVALILETDNGSTIIMNITEKNPVTAYGTAITDIDQSYLAVNNKEYLKIQGFKAMKDWDAVHPTEQYPDGVDKTTTLRLMKDNRLWMLQVTAPLTDKQTTADTDKIINSLTFTK